MRTLLALFVATLGLSSPAEASPWPQVVIHPPVLVVHPPPPPRYVAPPPPHPAAYWVEGNWAWTRVGWQWSPGYWVMPQRPPVAMHPHWGPSQVVWGPQRPAPYAVSYGAQRPNAYAVGPQAPMRPVSGPQRPHGR